MERIIEMGLFGRRSRVVESIPTELNQDWFFAWAEDIRGRSGLPQDAEWLGELYAKASAVIKHYCSPYIENYCPSWTHDPYDRYYKSDDLTPWGLASFIAGCPSSYPDGSAFIIDIAKSRLERFADIMVDPSIAE